jgi:hypothetical protein
MGTPERTHHHMIPWRRVVMVAIVMTFAVSAMWLVIRTFGESDIATPTPPPEPTAGQTIATPTAPVHSTPTTEPATPVVTEVPQWEAGSLPAMLEMAPDRLSDDSLPLNDVAKYSDIDGWMASNGIADPLSLAGPDIAEWDAQLDALALPASLHEFGLDPIWPQTYGFDLTQVDQVLVIGQAPDYVMIMRGDFDPELLQSAWVANGYQAVELEGMTIWSLYPGDRIDLSAPESRPAMGSMNNVILLEDGTLIAAARSARLGSVLQVVNGDAPSLAEHDDVQALLQPGTGVDTLETAVLSKGSLLQGTSDSMPELATPMPGTPEPLLPGTPEPGDELQVGEAALVLIGIWPPNDGQISMSIRIVMDDPGAATESAQMIQQLLRSSISPVTGTPYADRFGNPVASVSRGVVTVHAQMEQGPVGWLDVVSSRDLGFAFWEPEGG